MLGDISRVDHIYLACGYTDLRRGIDGLAQIVQQQFELDPFSNSLFLFCGKRRDRIKALEWRRISMAPQLCRDAEFELAGIPVVNRRPFH